MNYKQFLYSKLAEEASEVAQAAIKTQLFTEYSTDPRENTGETNVLKLSRELLDMNAVLRLIADMWDKEGIRLDFDLNPDQYIALKEEQLKKQWDRLKEIQ